MPQVFAPVSNFFIGTLTAAGVSGVTAVAWSQALTTLLMSATMNTAFSLATKALGTSGTDADGTTWRAVDYDA